MKNLIIYLVIGFAFLGQAQAQTPMSIHPRISFVEGADMVAFREAYMKTRKQLRQDYVDQTTQLLWSGAYGDEAYAMIRAYDQHISDLRHSGKSRWGLTFNGLFNSQLDKLYAMFRPPVRHLEFREDRGNLRPDFYLHGVYSVAARNEFLVTINLVNLKSGLSRSYSAQGTPEEVMVKLANQLFDEVQKTKFPAEINLAGRRLTLLDQNFIYVYTTAPMHHLWLQARAVCEYQGGRLPSSRELTTLAALGVYRGGIDARAMTREFYYWALEDMTVYVAQGARVVSTSNLNPTEFLQYLCVR